MQPNVVQQAVTKPLFDPSYLSLLNPHTWSVVGIVSSLLSLIFIIIIIFCIVRMFEIQAYDKMEIKHEIHEALLRDKEKARNENQRWTYITTLVESPNESDWRMAILEADSFLEEVLREKDMTGDTVSELLESAKSNGYTSIQNAWDAHIVRNKIAHEGSEYPVSQIEGRRVIILFA